jgi:hypothetical protein
MACSRGAGDKLLDKLAIEWSVNLFRIPRAGVRVGDVFVVQKRFLDQWDHLEDLYQPKLELPQPDRQAVGEMDQIQSRSYAADAGFDALQGFLVALGVPALPLRATINAARKSTVSVSFGVRGVTRFALLPGQIKREMEQRAPGARWGSIEPKRRYVVAHAVWKATSVQVKLTGSTETVGDLSAGLIKVASAAAGVSTATDTSGTISYDRREPIAFGIQVTGVRFDTGSPQLEGAPEPSRLQVRRDGQEAVAASNETSGVLIGARGGSPFVTLR